MLACALLLNHNLRAQSTSGNNNIGFGKFLGYNNAQNLEFRTNNTTRMQLMQNGNSNINGFNVNRSGFLGLSQDPGFFTGGPASPFSLLHLNGDNGAGNAQQAGYRDWMRYGITFTHNNDLMYIGPRKVGGNDVTDAVIAWADNSPGSPAGPDNLTFIWTTGGAAGTDLEVSRMTAAGFTGIGTSWSNSVQPKRPLDVIRVDGKPQFRISYASGQVYDEGPGVYSDFQTSPLGNLHIKPVANNQLRATTIGFLEGDEVAPLQGTVLDVGPGRTRIRELPEVSPNALIIGYRFQDVNMEDEDNFIGRLEFPTDQNSECFVLNGDGEWIDICNGEDCRWQDAPSQTTAGELDLFTGFDQEEDCYRGKVGIGVPLMEKAKLDVENFFERDGAFIGTFSRSRVFLTNTSERVIGVYGDADSDGWPGGTTTNIGVYGRGNDSRYTVGLLGEARAHPSGTSTSTAIGVAGFGSNDENILNIGVYGEATTISGYAGYFTGGNIVFMGNNPIFVSDSELKTEVEDITGASELLMSLNPKSYFMQSPEGRPIAFDESKQFGLIAQEVQEIMPEIVKTVGVPAVMDSTGFVDGTASEALGVQYNALIPFMIAAFKEQAALAANQDEELAAQNGMIESLQAQLAYQSEELENLKTSLEGLLDAFDHAKSDMDNCCQNKLEQNILEGKMGKVLLEQNAPNPFSNQTRIDFSLPEGVQVTLVISDGQGRKLETIVDGYLGEGAHSVTWDGSRYSPGMYYYSLYANGTLLTKKMIKQ